MNCVCDFCKKCLTTKTKHIYDFTSRDKTKAYYILCLDCLEKHRKRIADFKNFDSSVRGD